MSWYRDTQLFIYYQHSIFRVARVKNEYSAATMGSGFETEHEILNFSKHLFLVDNKESDFEAFKSNFPKNDDRVLKFINSQGLVVKYDFGTHLGTWSHEELGSPFYNLPGITNPITAERESDKKALEERLSNIEAKNSALQDEVNGNKNQIQTQDKTISDLRAMISTLKDEVSGKEALQQQVLDLTSQLEECRGARGGSSDEEPWSIGEHPVPSNWLPFEDLDILNFSRNIPLTVTKALGVHNFSEDNTTNVRATNFYRGVFPIVVVNVEELIPKEKARFDPDIWGVYNNAGIRYAARKLLESELLVEDRKSC